jgi:transposase-like protein
MSATQKRNDSRSQKTCSPPTFMNTTNEARSSHDESFKYAAVDFLNKNGNHVEAVAAELGVNASELRDWQKKLAEAATSKPSKPVGGMAKLRAENEALRNEILQLQVQWDILKTTLGVLSTTVGGCEFAG